MRALAMLPLVLLATIAQASGPAAVRMLDDDGDLVSVRAAAQDLLAVWEGDTLVVRVGDSSVLQWTPVNHLPDLVHAGVTVPGFLVGIPGREVFMRTDSMSRLASASGASCPLAEPPATPASRSSAMPRGAEDGCVGAPRGPDEE